MENASSTGTDTRPVVEIYDTTLRDGSQREGISYTLEDKLRIADRLDNFGVSYIEGGWPGSNPKDLEFFERGRDCAWKHAKLSAFGMTRRAGSGAADDRNLQALLLAGTPACTVVGKTSTLHVTEVVRTTLDENVKMIEESVAFLCAAGREVIYDAEHFFDGYALDPAYAPETWLPAKRVALARWCSVKPTAAACPGTCKRWSPRSWRPCSIRSASTPTTTAAAASPTA